MKVFITGHLGMMGGHIWKGVRAKKVGFDLKVGQDICDYEAVKEAMKDCTHVVHVAGITARSGDMGNFLRVNVNGTYNVLEAARENGVERFVYISSTGYYGLDIDGEITPKYLPIDENHPIVTQETGVGRFENYNTSKVMAEQLCGFYGTNYFEVIALRSGPLNTLKEQYPEGFDKKVDSYQKKAFWARNDPKNIGAAVWGVLKSKRRFSYRPYNICNKYIDKVITGKDKVLSNISSERFRKEICDLPL